MKLFIPPSARKVAPVLPAAGLRPGRRAPAGCLLVYRIPGTSAEFCLRDTPQGIQEYEGVAYLLLASGCELRLDWLVAINGFNLAA